MTFTEFYDIYDGLYEYIKAKAVVESCEYRGSDPSYIYNLNKFHRALCQLNSIFDDRIEYEFEEMTNLKLVRKDKNE